MSERLMHGWLEIQTQKTQEQSSLLLKGGGERSAPANQWRCGLYYKLSSNYVLQKVHIDS